MEEKFLDAINEFITCRMNEHSMNTPKAIQEAISQAGECLTKLEQSLSTEQKQLFREMEDALCVQTGEEMRYYYRAGLHDAVRLLFERKLTD